MNRAPFSLLVCVLIVCLATPPLWTYPVAVNNAPNAPSPDSPPAVSDVYTPDPTTTASLCNVTGDGNTTVPDVQLEMNEALGSAPPANDLDMDGLVNIVDVQIVLNAVLGSGCSAATTLTITTSGTGIGTVGTSLPGTSCGSVCLIFSGGTVITVTATPAAGSTFAGWSGACPGTGSCALTMNSNQAVTATFNLAVNSTLTITSLGATSVQPFSLLTISGSGFAAQVTTSGATTSPSLVVQFADSAGLSVQVNPVAVNSGSLTVSVPPWLNAVTGALQPGTVAVQLVQTTVEGTTQSNAIHGLQIQDLPTPTTGPGELTLAYLTGASTYAGSTLVSLITGTPLGTSTLTSGLASQVANLNSLTAQIQAVILDPTQSITLGTSSIGISDLAKVDRMILGLLTVQASATELQSSAIASIHALDTQATPGCQAQESAQQVRNFESNANIVGAFVGYYGAANSSPACNTPAAINTSVNLIEGAGAAAIGLLLLAGAPAAAVALPSAALLAVAIESAGGEVAVGGALGQATSGAQQLVQSGLNSLNSLLWLPVEKAVLGAFATKVGLNTNMAVGAAGALVGAHAVHDVFVSAPPLNGSVTSQQFTVTVSSSQNGEVVSLPGGIFCGAEFTSCSGAFAAGTVVTMTVTPNPGSGLSGWSGACNGNGVCTVNLNSNVSLTPAFEQVSGGTCTLAQLNAWDNICFNAYNAAVGLCSVGNLLQQLACTNATIWVWLNCEGACTATTNSNASSNAIFSLVSRPARQ